MQAVRHLTIKVNITFETDENLHGQNVLQSALLNNCIFLLHVMLKKHLSL